MDSSPLSNSNTESYAEQVVSQLKQDILQGYFAPNEKLLMSRLKARYNMGVSPLREALSQLLVEQLVVVENQKGFRVHPVSKAELKDIYHTRAHIESLCIKLAIENANDEWEGQIIASDHRLKKTAHLLSQTNNLNSEQARQQLQQWEATHHRFHSAITSGCQSPALLKVRHSLYEKASRYRNLWLNQYMVDNQVFDTNEKDHDQLIEALLKRNSKLACELIYQHLLNPYKLLQGSEF
ncbi:DNA-binding transcriptional regulator CsiR [Oceaniserpentilla sp. 4NH20-0058]|uniref:DNA-binding transcriptional regulator CsiR n=1 Tax=Oceaniserpentilla sp. 4NH20-0058 TaxID=3127660 RepID=UPI00310A26F1